MVFPIPAPLTPLRELDFFCHFDRSADGGGTKWRNLIVLSKKRDSPLLAILCSRIRNPFNFEYKEISPLRLSFSSLRYGHCSLRSK